MPFTVYTHRQLPQLSDNWIKSRSDRTGYDKYEIAMTEGTRKRSIAKILTLSILTLGTYFIYLKCSRSGRADLANLKARKIIHYVKTSNFPSVPQKTQQTAQLTAFSRETAAPVVDSKNLTNKSINTHSNSLDTQSSEHLENLPSEPVTNPSKSSNNLKSKPVQPKSSKNEKEKQDVIDFLNYLDSFSEHHLMMAALRNDVLREHKISQALEVCPFDSSNVSNDVLEKFVTVLKQFQPQRLKDFEQKLNEKGLEIPISSWRKRNSLEAEVMSIQRLGVPTLDGKMLPADTQTVDCVVLKGLDGKRFGVKVVSEDEPNVMVLVVKKNGKKKEVCVNKDELAARLQLDPLYVAVNDGKLANFIEEQKTEQVLKNYQRIFDKQQKLNPSKALAPEILMKIVRIAFILRRNLAHGMQLSNEFEFRDIAERLKGREIVAAFRGEKLYLSDVGDIAKPDILGKGGEAIVIKVNSLSTKKNLVMKLFDGGGLLFNSPASSEAKILERLHEGYPIKSGNKGRVPGIQQPFHGIINLGSKTGILQREYAGSLRDAMGFIETNQQVEETKPTKHCLFATLNDKLESLYPLIYGLHYCYTAKGLIHGDIKPRNILYSIDPATNKINLYLADFGSALLCDPTKPSSVDYDKPWTMKYSLLADRNKREELGKMANSSLENWQKFIHHTHKWDMFSLGCVIADLLVPGEPYLDDTSMSSMLKREILEKGKVPKELCDLIESMLQKSPENRPSIDQVLSRFQEIMSQRQLSLAL